LICRRVGPLLCAVFHLLAVVLAVPGVGDALARSKAGLSCCPSLGKYVPTKKGFPSGVSHAERPAARPVTSWQTVM